MPWDDDLTDEQTIAASHIGRHARLLAGPGTGKTLCLTRRILYLIEEEDVNAANIMALTFTRAATAELKRRIVLELGEDSELPYISTLHSFALRTILRQFSGSRLPQPIRVADDYEERHIIEEDLKLILGLENIREVRGLLHQLSADWERLSADESDWEQRFPNPAFLGAWQEHREIYGYILRAELVYQLKHAIEEGEVDISAQLSHLLVDEYQDLNACDLAAIQRLSSSGLELYVAGDDDQSIYGFRYANPDGIRRFRRQFRPSAALDLEECQRCDRRILELALYVARQDPRRIDKRLVPRDNASRGYVQILRFSNQRQEASGIAAVCEWLVETHNIPPQNILILLRSDRNRQFSTPIRQALDNRDISVATVANPLAALEEVEGRHFLCLLRLIDNPSDHLAWRTLFEIRRNRIGTATIAALYDIARRSGQTFYSALAGVSDDPSQIPRGGNNVRLEFERIQRLVSSATDEDTSDLTAFIERMAAEHIIDEDAQSQILGVFYRVLEEGIAEDLNQLLRAINVSLQAKEQETESGSINIMTMHQAKGLSADAVFVVAAEDEYLPGRATGEQIGDERRLLYVSLTRARRHLYLTYCDRRIGAQRHSGRTSGLTRRHLTTFLSGGPIGPTSGIRFVNNL
jgi:DNA helicase-2/ATP-dependent DNA helicase PcrA